MITLKITKSKEKGKNVQKLIRQAKKIEEQSSIPINDFIDTSFLYDFFNFNNKTIYIMK